MNAKDIQIIRPLAAKYMEMASSEKQAAMNKRMLDTNDLKIVRPPVLMDEIPWYQMDIDGELKCLCEENQAREVEYELRKAIYRWKHFSADTLFEPFWRVKQAYDSTGIGVERDEKILRTDEINNIVSHELHDALPDEEAAAKLHDPVITMRPDIDEQKMNYLTDLFGDALPVRLCGQNPFYFAAWDQLAYLRGVEPIYIDMYDRPEFLHLLMEKMISGAVAQLDYLEENSHISPDSVQLHCTPAQVSGRAEDGWKATWFRCMAQMFGNISPAMHEEFDIQYMFPLAERFAYTYYGCCEPLDNKIEALKKIPNLRKLGVSPWANVDVCAEQIRGDYVYSRKPNPANVAVATDPDNIRREIEATVQACIRNGCPCEFVLKDISTVSHRPENLIIWADAVSEVLDKYY